MIRNIALKRNFLSFVIFISLLSFRSFSQNPDHLTVIKPGEIDEVLTNPGMGFMTFQRFNGDDLNEGAGWTEGFPIDYQSFDGDLTNKNHPATTIAYWRIYWKFIEPEMGKFRWDMLDKALAVARSRGQSLLLRIAPYGTGNEKDVPEWYRKIVGPEKNWKFNSPVNGWMVDPEDPRYAEFFGGMIKALGDRYDGHPDLEAVDISIVGAWGEGAGSELLSQTAREALINAYTGSFRTTPLIALLMDKKTNIYADSQIPVGWRVDCIGDLGFWASEQNGWTHMNDFYPREIINCNVQDDWEKSPISFEICGTFLSWRDGQKYNREQVKYIFDQSLKWHMSSFNAKSSPVPPEWEDLVNDWLRKMGYRYALRRFTYPESVQQNGKVPFTSWWENKGVAPCYKDFTMAIRLKSGNREAIWVTDANIKEWLPGDIVCDGSFFVPWDFPPGICDIQIAIVDKLKHEPRVNLAIEGKRSDGWYQLGKINIIN
ncbi:MAG: hypothetical protein A2X05_15260 [Bacteroidetes bacterium GWE2_41_25]|nr:MAG: hypothetical protein A2X06_09125 [Bacteroidetes bacterium GWC2_40_22]OFY10865.1 MAG: hypothetical protein A2X05_15260 [Bacteroidetes bacterium GWE2_41_25]HAM08828.1 DUF4832 domain-containing protein [Bacteroidales bacterium]HBH83445.1 DUF4832 domain-containing protein [Bacteroidales bacterium]HCU18064.1 DUF4832 domain-containing protein [Bacteroidales bacterium]